MGRPKKEEINISDESVDLSKNVLNSLLNGYKEDHYNFVEHEPIRISSGSLGLDSLISIKTGDAVRLTSTNAEAGKTSQCFLFAKNFTEKIPNSRILYIKSEGRLSPELKERTGLQFTEKTENWNDGVVFVLSCNIFEVIAQFVESLLKITREQDRGLVIIIDSLDGLILKNDIEKQFGESVKCAGVPLLTKLLFRRICLPLSKTKSLLLICSQYSAHIQMNPYAKDPPKLAEASGGNAINFQSNYILNYAPRYGSDLILKNPNEKPDKNSNPILGHYVTLEIKKSANSENSGYRIKIPIKRNRIGNGVWVEKEMVDLLIAWGLLKKAGSWFSFEDNFKIEAQNNHLELKDKFQGLDNIYSYIEENPLIFKWFYKKMQCTILT